MNFRSTLHCILAFLALTLGVSAQAVTISVVGTLVQDPAGCTLVELGTGVRYILDDDGGLLPGAPISVTGDLDVTCASFCFVNDGCIFNAVVTAGLQIDVCGVLVQDGAGCKLVELTTGERYILDSDGGLPVGSGIRVQGTLDTTCFSICFANDGCINGALTTLGCSSIYGCGVNPAGSFSILSGSATLGSTITFGVDNPLGTQSAGSLPIVMGSAAPAAGFPCGFSLPNWGMSAPGSVGELLIQLGGANPIMIGAPWTGSGPAPVDLTLPNLASFAGVPVYVQGLMLDVGSTGVKFGLTNAAEIVIGG